jgi:hypothetical protein
VFWGANLWAACVEVGIANTTEYAQVLILGCDAIKGNIRAGDADYLAREVI